MDSRPALTLQIENTRTDEPIAHQFRRVRDTNVLDINYDAYEKYISDNYPNLYTLDYYDGFDSECKGLDDMEINEMKAEMEKSIAKDNQLLNPIDISMYKDCKLPPDIFDGIARRLYPMGFMGKYSRVATALEAGRNYVFTFQQFAHIYPFLRGCTGDAFKLRNWLGMEELKETRRYDAMIIKNRNGNLDINSDKEQPKYYPNYRRSQFNGAFISKPTFYNGYVEGNPVGAEWSYLTVDQSEVKMKCEYWKNYETGNDKSPIDNNYHIYEKYLCCSTNSCSAMMRIILDPIHEIVILSMKNPHFDCLEAHKRRVFDAVRKLYVIHGADLDLIDRTYMGIPRRYGLAYVEAWISSEDMAASNRADHTPSYLHYNWELARIGESWSSSKTRGLVKDAFSIEDQGSKKKLKMDVKVPNVELNKIKKRDEKDNGITNWMEDTVRYDRFSIPFYRDAWEFHITQDKNEKLREIYKVWRKVYYECEDFLNMMFQNEQTTSLCNVYNFHKFEQKCNSIFNSNVKELDSTINIVSLSPEEENEDDSDLDLDLWIKQKIIKHKRRKEYNKYLMYKQVVLRHLSNPIRYCTFTNINRFYIPYPLSDSMSREQIELNYKDKQKFFLIGSNLQDIAKSESIMFVNTFRCTDEDDKNLTSLLSHPFHRYLYGQHSVETHFSLCLDTDPLVFENDEFDYGDKKYHVSTIKRTFSLNIPQHYPAIVDTAKKGVEKAQLANKRKEDWGSEPSKIKFSCTLIKYGSKNDSIDDMKMAFILMTHHGETPMENFLKRLSFEMNEGEKIDVTSLRRLKINADLKNFFNITQVNFEFKPRPKCMTPNLEYFIVEHILNRKIPNATEAKKYMIPSPPMRLRDTDFHQTIVKKGVIFNTAGNARMFIKEQENLMKDIIENCGCFFNYDPEMAEDETMKILWQIYIDLAKDVSLLSDDQNAIGNVIKCFECYMNFCRSPVIEKMMPSTKTGEPSSIFFSRSSPEAVRKVVKIFKKLNE